METLEFTPIGSPIPNRGFGQEDIQLFGLTYLQKVSDQGPSGALHIEPGIWVTQPATSFPDEASASNGQIVGRMGSIPHGNALLAQGSAQHFAGPPVLFASIAEPYKGSIFPSFNSTPFAASIPTPPAPFPYLFNAAGSTMKGTAAKTTGALPFPQYDASVPEGPIPPGPIPPGPVPPGIIYNPVLTLNTRTPYDTNPPEPPLPPDINGVAMQTIINDPITLLQKVITDQVAQGYTFEGTVLNISTLTTLNFLSNADSGPLGPQSPPVQITGIGSTPLLGGGIGNIPFLGVVVNQPGPFGSLATSATTSLAQNNAQTGVVYATFWIERVTNQYTGHCFMQLQIAQMVVLNFPFRHPLSQPPATVGLANNGETFMGAWPHVSVATFVKDFA